MKRLLLVAALGAALPAQDGAVAVARALLAAHTPATGDVDARAATLLAAVAANPRSPAAAVLVHATQELIPLLADPGAFAAASARLLQRDDLHGSVHAAVAGVTALGFLRTGRVDEASAALRTAGKVEAVLVFGPFGDDGDQYLGVVFPPELRLEAGELPGRFGPVRPRVARAELADLGRISLREPGTGRQGCYYALHQPQVAQATACYVELWATGAFEVFVNGARIGSFDGYADPSTGTRWFPVVLRKGTNHVLVKTALNGFDAIALRYVDGAGRPIAVREPAAVDRIETPAAATGDEPPAPGPFVSPLLALDRAARAASPGEDAVALRLATALAAAELNDHRRTLEHVLAAERVGPLPLPMRLALACAQGRAELWPEELRRSRSRAVLEAAREEAGEHHWLLEQLAQHLADEDKYEDAIRLLRPLVESGKAGPEVFARLHGFYERLEFRADAARLRDAWLKRSPADARAVLAEANERARFGDVRGALAVLRAAREVAPGDRQINQRAFALALDAGDRELALQVHADAFRVRPDAPSAAHTLAELHTRFGDRDEAVRAWQRLAAHPEASANDAATAGRHLLQLGADAEAEEVLRAALAREPAQHAVRRLLGRLTGETPDYPALALFRRDLDALIASFTPGEREQTAPTTLVLDQMIVEFLPDGSAVEEVNMVRRINDLRGVETHQEARNAARADEVVALYTVVDGQRYVPHRVSNSFSMPRLAPGAFVVESWRRLKRAPGAEPWRGPEFHFQSTEEPYALSELVVITPPVGRGRFRVRNFSGEPETRTLPDGRTAHVFVRRDVPRLQPEKLAPPENEVVPIVTWGEDRAAGATARRARAHFAYRLRSSTLVEEKAAELTRDLTSDRAKLAAIHNFVHDTIPTSSGASDPTAVLLRKQGARFWLEVALLRAAGVPLRLATAARRADALRDEAAPLFLGEVEYGVDAVQVLPADGEPVWLFQDDPRYWPLGAIAAERMGAAVLLLDDWYGWTPAHVPAGDVASQEGFVVQGEASLDDQGTATLRVRGTLLGRNGFAAADQLREREDNIKKLAARQIASQVLEGWTPRSVDLITEKGRPLGLTGEVIKRRAVSAAGDLALLDLPLARESWVADLGDRPERTQPLSLRRVRAGAWEVTVDPGEAFALVELPPDVLVRHPLLEYAQSFRVVDGKVVVQRRWMQRPGDLPAARYGEWLDLLRRLDLAEDVKLKLRRR